ncbi:hypothetical protein GYH30_001510 [Glycine max]|uniref:Arginase n=1 Tax=Glycine max TaxID=3847 RepID=A0A0R0LJU1_SOYBN|nr:hypothetical protein GYH30_001510 [Glycine max]
MLMDFVKSLSLFGEKALVEWMKELIYCLGGAVATSTLLGVPLGHNSLFREGPSFAPPFIWEGIWCGSANSTTEEGKDLKDLRIMADVGDIPIQEIDERGKLLIFVRAIPENLGGPVDVLRFDAHPDLYDKFEGKYYSRASSFARIMEGGYICSLTLVDIRSINKEGREQAKKFGIKQYEMRHFSKDRPFLENLKLGEGVKGVYISIDVDCLDPGYAVGVSHYESGGDIVGGDMIEYNPQRDTPDRMIAMVAKMSK